MDVTVHHLDNSRSQRVLWLLEELGVPYEIVHHYRDPKTMRAPAALRAIHPLGKAPVVVLGAGDDALVLAESGAILEHLAETFGEARLRPEPGTDAHRRYRYFMHYAEGSMMPPLLVKLIFGKLRTAPLPFFLRPVVKTIANKVDATFTDPEIVAHLAFVNAELTDRPFLCGEALTAADVQMSFPLEAARARYGFAEYPALSAYLDRVHARDAYQRALERGGPYDLLMG